MHLIYFICYPVQVLLYVRGSHEQWSQFEWKKQAEIWSNVLLCTV